MSTERVALRQIKKRDRKQKIKKVEIQIIEKRDLPA